MIMKDYYNLLGVSKDATPKDIKKAYRGLSMKYHPDHNSDGNATEKMAEINEAYEVLSDENKRKDYDNPMQSSPFPGSQHPFANQGGGHDINEIFKMFGGTMFGNMGTANMDININGNRVHIFRNGNGFQQHVFRHVQKPQPITKHISISLEQAYNGCDIDFSYSRWCIINNQKVTEEVNRKVQISPGVNNQDNYQLKDQGHIIDDNTKGDLHIIIDITNSSIFERRNMDLFIKKEISLKESLCGFNFDFVHLSGKKYSINNDDKKMVIVPGYTRVIPQLGMKTSNQTGNLIIEFQVKFPEKLSEDQVKQIENIL